MRDDHSERKIQPFDWIAGHISDLLCKCTSIRMTNAFAETYLRSHFSGIWDTFALALNICPNNVIEHRH